MCHSFHEKQIPLFRLKPPVNSQNIFRILLLLLYVMSETDGQKETVLSPFTFYFIIQNKNKLF